MEITAIGEKCLEAKITLKLSTEGRYNHICENYIGKQYSLEPGHLIEIEDLSSFRTKVHIKDILYEMTENMLKNCLEQYEDVTNMCYKLRTDVPEYFRDHTDRMTVWMKIERSIPMSIYVKQARAYIYISNSKQDNTCFRCGIKGHSYKICQN